MSFSSDYWLDEPAGSFVDDSGGTRVYIESERGQVCLRFRSLAEFGGWFDAVQADYMRACRQQSLAFVAKPHPDGVALHLAQMPACVDDPSVPAREAAFALLDSLKDSVKGDGA